MNAYYKTMSGDDIYHALKDDILTLKLKPGQMLSENEISRNYNVSRTPVKTAFMRLKGEKYIEIVPQKGSYVTLLDIKYIRDIIYMRSVLETELFRLIIDMGSPKALLEQMKENLKTQDALTAQAEIVPKEFYDVDSEYHRLIFAFTDRLTMWDIIQDFQVYYTRFRILDIATTERYRQLFREHVSIYTMLKEKNFSALKDTVYSHLHGNLKVLSPRIAGEFREYFIQS